MKFYRSKSDKKFTLKHIVAAILIYKPTSESDELLNLKSIVKIPMVLLSFMSGLVGGIYCSFLRGLLLQMSMDKGYQTVSFYVYLTIVLSGAVL